MGISNSKTKPIHNPSLIFMAICTKKMTYNNLTIHYHNLIKQFCPTNIYKLKILSDAIQPKEARSFKDFAI